MEYQLQIQIIKKLNIILLSNHTYNQFYCTQVIHKKNPMLPLYSPNNNHTFLSLNKIITQLLSQKQPPACIKSILKQFNTINISQNNNNKTIGQFIDKLCEQVLCTIIDSSSLVNINKYEQIDVILNKFLVYEHHVQLQINNNNQQQCKLYRKIISQYFHYLVHNSRMKKIVKIIVLFYKFVCLQMLERETYNYFMIVLVLSFQNFSEKYQLKVIKACLRSLYEKSILYVGVSEQERNINKRLAKNCVINDHIYQNSKPENLSFTMITYIIYFGDMINHKNIEQKQALDLQIIKKIISKPIQALNLAISFREQFPSDCILKCNRDIASISKSIIDNFFLKSLLCIYLDFKLQNQVKTKVYQMIQTLVMFNLNVLTVKNMIKRLQVTSMQGLQEKWKGVFVLLKAALPQKYRSQNIYQTTDSEKTQNYSQKSSQNKFFQLNDLDQQQSNLGLKNLQQEFEKLTFTTNSNLKYQFQHQFNGFYLQFKSFRIYNEYLLLKLKNQAYQIWIMYRHLQQQKYFISAISFKSNSPISLDKIQVSLNPFQKHFLDCKVIGDQIVFIFGNSSKKQNAQKSNKISIKNIKPKQIIVGSTQPQALTYISQISTFHIYYWQGKNAYNLIAHKKKSLHQISNDVTLIQRLSLVSILKKLGDLNLFFLITFHIIKKVDNQELLKNMLKQIINFLFCLVLTKGVYKMNLNQQIQEDRFYNVRCLVWLASKYKRDPEVIIQIFKFLSIRGNKRPLESLQIFSSVGLWKQNPQKSHQKLLDKFRKICYEVPPEKSQQLVGKMKRVILDFTIYYKNNQLVSENLQDEYLIKHSQILKLVYDIITKEKPSTIITFIQFILKILYILLDRTKNSDQIDTSIGFQLSNLAYRLLFFVRQQQFKSTKESLKIKSKQKIIKPGSKSLNLPLSFIQKDQQSLILKIEQTLPWASQILFNLSNQLQHNQQKIKYCDWSWDFEKQKINTSSFFANMKKSIPLKNFKIVTEDCIKKNCENIHIGMLSFNRNFFGILNQCNLYEYQWNVYWQMNLFDQRISFERFVDTIKLGHFQHIPWDDVKIFMILSKSFNLLDDGTPVKLPQKFLQSMNSKDPNFIHNSLLGIYLDICQKIETIQKNRYAEKIIYMISMMPDSLYTNTQLLRQQLSKQKRNFRIVQLIQKHLIIKQLIKQGFKLMKEAKNPESQILFTTINAFQQSQISVDTTSTKPQVKPQQQIQVNNKTKLRKRSQDLNVFSQQGSQNFQDSILLSDTQCLSHNITTQKLKQSLQYMRILAIPTHIQAFYKISNSEQKKEQTRKQIEAHQLNFNLNIDAVIKILEQNTNQTRAQKLNKLQNYIFFIEKHIYQFSKMIVSKLIFGQIKSIQHENVKLRPKRKKSFKTSNYKFKEIAQTMLQQFLKERRKCIYKMENVWSHVEKTNKEFWQIFFKSEKKNQSVDSICNGLKLKGLIKIDHQKREIELPKNITTLSNKISISEGTSEKDLISQQYNQSTIFQASIYKKQQTQEKQQNQKISNDFRTKKRNQFSVLYITTTTIYQGSLICEPTFVKFSQFAVPDQSLYDMVCANENEQRTAFQIQKKKLQFEINLNQKSTIIAKKYLYYDIAVQIYSQKQTSFFMFRNSKNRQNFIKNYQHLKGTIQDDMQLLQVVHKQTQRWMNGDITNFTYLMHLNDLSGRTFNDMSQYYIFPWVLTNYHSQKFNRKFFQNQKNYRVLSKPVGSLNPKRLQQLLSRYKQSSKYQQTQNYLYGSFCSNPAIVCNYLVRLQPFSMHHYLLQSKQFDLADRIFYSISSQFNGCYTNVGDYKQLIPQFYSCPEFLRNRNKYKFGQKQNKQIVDNVKLPEWANYQFNKKQKIFECAQVFLPQQQFVFRMRKCLQSDYVTKNLNYWIDLIFGLYNRKQKAMERNNLYISNIYKNQLKNKEKMRNKQAMLVFFKQFGQMPKDLFTQDHKSYKNTSTCYKLGNSSVYLVLQLSSQVKNNKRYYADSHYFVSWDNLNINIVDLKTKSGLLQRTQHTITQIPLKNQQISQLTMLTIQNQAQQSKKLQLLIYLKNGKLIARQMSISIFRKKLQIKQQKQNFFKIQTNFQILKLYQQQKLIIFTSNNNIKIYEYVLQANSIQKSGDIGFGMNRFQLGPANDNTIKILLNKKLQLRLNLIFQFNQHRSSIQFLSICQSYGLLISIDSNRKVYILKLQKKQKQIEIRQYFRLKKLTNCQNIMQFDIHQMGYIIILTSLNIIHVYNFMGDHVACFDGHLLNIINKRMQNKIQSKISQPLKKVEEYHHENVRKKSDNDIPTGLTRLLSYELSQSDSQRKDSGILTQQLILQQKQQKINNSRYSQKIQDKIIITYFKIWNHQSGQLILGTNDGHIYRFDLYIMDDCQKINFNKVSINRDKINRGEGKIKRFVENQNIQFISVNRVGRHWQCWVASSQQLYKIQSQDFRHADKRNQEYKKKYNLQ